MMKINRKFDYAMILLTDLGLRSGQSLSARRISERYGLSPSLAANVLKGLQRHSLVRSTRGVHGGYALSRDPAEISLASVIVAIEGKRGMTNCQVQCGSKEVRCPSHAVCPIRGYLGLLERKIKALFDSSTLADVIASARASAEPLRAHSSRQVAVASPRGAAR